jgi:HAD superfamily hydrolase (TIGR01509 family)
MTFPLVIFDLDGTLVDSFEDMRAALAAAFAAADIAADESMLGLARRGMPLEDIYEATSGRTPRGDGFDTFVRVYRETYLPSCTATTRPFPGVVDMLAALRAVPWRPKLGLATTKRTETAVRVLAGTGLSAFFDVVSGSDGIAHKPDPAVLNKVAAEAGVAVERAVMVGDTDRDVGAAHAARAKCIAVTWGGFPRAELERLRPDWLADRPEDVVRVITAGGESK